MRKIVFLLFALLTAMGQFSEAASPRLTEKSILKTVQKNPHLRAYYSKDKSGRKVLVITNRSKRGNRTPRTAQVVPASSRSLRTLTRTPIREQQPLNPRLDKNGIPVVPNRNPQRPINPYKRVNPFKDPTAIPSTTPPDSE